jgi:hypothetical protein
VHFTSTDPGFVAPADAQLTSGTGVFNFALKTAGSQTISATDTIHPEITGTTQTITVVPAGITGFTVITPSPVTAGVAFSFTINARDLFGNTVSNYSGTVHFTSSDALAVLPANATLTNGTGTFSATLRTAGSETITAADTVTSSIAGTSNQISVPSPGATHFAITAPASATAGTAISFTVTALDVNNNTATNYAGTVHFTSIDGSAVLPANATLTNGTGTFTAALRTAGSQTINATDTVTSSITATSSSITVATGNATHFRITAPASATAGTTFPFTVTALDSGNNPMASYSGTVHFTSSDALAVLPANATLTNGTGTFSATLRTAGSETITAADTVTSSIAGTSNQINVTSPAAIASSVNLTSSRNPSSFGEPVTFTATVTGATPTGTVTFKDGATVLGTGPLNASGQASFTTTSLKVGSHSITAAYGGNAGNLPSTSTALAQAVNVPADSIKLRALQIAVTKMEAQSSGQAISGAIDDAISEGFAGNGAPIAASDNGVRLNFAAEPQEQKSKFEERAGDAFAALGYPIREPQLLRCAGTEAGRAAGDEVKARAKFNSGPVLGFSDERFRDEYSNFAKIRRSQELVFPSDLRTVRLDISTEVQRI